MSSRLTKKSLVSVPGPVGEHAVRRAAVVGVRAPACRRRARSSRARSASSRLARSSSSVSGGSLLAGRQVVAEAVGRRLEHGERLDVGLLLRRVGAPGCERHGDVEAGVLRRLLDRRAAAEHDQVGQRDLLAAGLASLKSCWIPSSVGSTLASAGRLVDRPSPSAARGGCARRWRRRACRCRGSVAADAHAVATELRRPTGPRRGPCAFSAATSASPTSSWSTAGTGSCQSCGSAAPTGRGSG